MLPSSDEEGWRAERRGGYQQAGQWAAVRGPWSVVRCLLDPQWVIAGLEQASKRELAFPVRARRHRFKFTNPLPWGERDGLL